VPHALSFHEVREHFFGVDGDEGAMAAGEDFVFFVQDFGGVNVGSALDFDFAAFDAERLVQRDGLEIFDGHLASECDNMMQLVYFAHSIVEDAGDDASVAVAWRSGVTLAEAEVADEGSAFFIENEFEAHAVGIVHAADEAVVLLHLHVASVVALGARGHEGILPEGLVRQRARSVSVDPQCRNSLLSRRLHNYARNPFGKLRTGFSTAVVLRFRETQPSLKMTESRSFGDILLTIN